jgi:hypothetical protein
MELNCLKTHANNKDYFNFYSVFSETERVFFFFKKTKLGNWTFFSPVVGRFGAPANILPRSIAFCCVGHAHSEAIKRTPDSQ